jgi:hypothetical protein
VVFEKENNNRHGYGDREKEADQRNKKHQVVHMWCEVGRLLRI